MNKYKNSFIKHLSKTWKNKLVSMLLVTLGVISVPLLDNDGTVLLLTILMGIPLIFETENRVLNWRD